MDQQQKILNKAITIQEIQLKQTTGGSKYAIKDHEGRTFNFFTTKKDGGDTSVFAQFKNMGLKIGDTVLIGYVEDEFEREGKKVISKKIINFRETNDAPSQTTATGQSFNGGANRGQSGHSGDAFGRRLGVQGHINALLSNPNYYGGQLGAPISAVVSEAIAVEDEAEKQLSPLRQAVQAHAPSVLDEDLPVIQQGEDLSGEDVPF
jgi:hypothetical protein